LLADELAPVVKTEDKARPVIWGVLDHHKATGKLHVEIPRSKWVEQILPATGFGKTHLLELPTIPIEKCAGVKAAFEALQQAQNLERQGFYDEAVGSCRKALEPFFETVDKPDKNGNMKKVSALKASWETRLGKQTYEWLDGSLRAVKQAVNGPHHLSSTSFRQMEAQMLIIVTTSLVAYAVKTQPEDNAAESNSKKS